MPVLFDDYDPEDGRLDLSEGTNAHTILSALVEADGLGFTPKEIHEETGVPRGSVGTTLKRLETHGLVRHKGEYWAAVKDDRLAAYTAMILGKQNATERVSDDAYAQDDDWVDTLPDLDADGAAE